MYIYTSYLHFIYIYIRERRREGESKGGTEPTAQAGTLTGNHTSDLLLCRMTPNQLSHTCQDRSLYFEMHTVSHMFVFTQMVYLINTTIL